MLITLAWLVIAVPPADASLKAIWGPVDDAGRHAPRSRSTRSSASTFSRSSSSGRGGRDPRPADPRSPRRSGLPWPSSVDSAVARGAPARDPRRDHGQGHAGLGQRRARRRSWAPTTPRDYADFLVAAARRYRTRPPLDDLGRAEPRRRLEPLPPNSPRGPRATRGCSTPPTARSSARSRRNIVIGGDDLDVRRRDAAEVHPLDAAAQRHARRAWTGSATTRSRAAPRSSAADPYSRASRDFSDVDTFAREVQRAYRHRTAAPRPAAVAVRVHGLLRPANRAFDFFVSRAEQAKWVSGAFRIAHRHRYVAGLGWFTLLDEPVARPRPDDRPDDLRGRAQAVVLRLPPGPLGAVVDRPQRARRRRAARSARARAPAPPRRRRRRPTARGCARPSPRRRRAGAARRSGTSSASPPAREATTGSPAAIASSAASGRISA